MPKKKTGQRKKAEKQKLRQKEIRSGKEAKQLADWACNANMVRKIDWMKSHMILLLKN